MNFCLHIMLDEAANQWQMYVCSLIRRRFAARFVVRKLCKCNALRPNIQVCRQFVDEVSVQRLVFGQESGKQSVRPGRPEVTRFANRNDGEYREESSMQA
jgi:hypothetical protein